MSKRRICEKWRELAREDLRGRDPETLGLGDARRASRIKPLYTAADLEELEALDTLPGAAPVPARPARDDVREPPLDDPPVRRLLDRRGVERLLPREPRGRPEGALGRLRSRHPPRLRLGPPARDGRRRQGRRRDRLGRGHEDPLRRHPARPDVGLDDDERRGAAGARLLHRRRRGAGRRRRRSSPGPSRTTSSRSSWSATPTSIRPSRACGSWPTSSSTPRSRCRSSTRSRSAATTCRRPARRRCTSWPSRSPTASSTCARRSRRASRSTTSRRGSRSSGRSA